MGVFNVAVKPKDMDVEPIETLSLYERYTKTKLFKAVKPYFFCLYLTGMHFSKSYKECEKGKLESTNKKRSKIPTVSQVYSTLILLLFWVNVVRHIFMLPPFNFGTAYFLKLVTFHTMFLSAVSLSCNYAANCNSSLFPKLFLLWSELPNDEKRVRNLSRGCIFIILHVCFLMGGRQAIIIRGYSQPSFKENITWPFVLENQIAMLVVRCIVYFLDTMDIAIWAFSLTQFYSISLAFALDYNAINEDLTRAVKSSPKLSEQTFKEIKSNHQKLCELVELADGFLSPYLAFLLLTQICNVCFIFYSAVYKEGIESSFMFGLVCLGVQSFLTLLGAVIPAAYLNTKAHAAVDVLHNMSVSSFSQDMALEIQLLLSRLTTSSIGFTVLNLFPIDKGSILTILAAVSSYMLLLIQFSPSGDTASYNQQMANLTLNETVF